MGTLKVDGHIEGNFIKANWLYTASATEQTSTNKIACIGSDNFIYYITPTNMSVGKATVATQVGRNGFYTAMRDWYEGGTTYSYVRIDLGQVTTWTMMSLELTIRESYQSGRSGKLHIYGNYSSSAEWENFYATRGERLSSNIKVYGSDKRYIYIAGVNAWGGVSIDQLLMGDSAYYYDWTSTVTMSGVDALPSTYQTATMIRSWTSEDTIPFATASTSATYLKDASTSTATYLNYGASSITSTSWMAAWNGYELRAMSPDYLCASRLYSTDSSYKYSSSNPYYGYLTYSAPYWDFKVSPATPADVRVSRAYSAGTADSASWASGATYAQSVYGTYTGSGGNQVPSYIGANRTKFNMMRNFGSADIGGYMDCILMNNYSWSDVPYATGLGITKVNGYPRAMIANGPQDSWAYTAELLTTYNYSWWAVPVSGGTMTGTLNIENHTQNGTYDALLRVSHHSTREWNVIIDGNGSYDYGLYINCGQGNYGLYLNGGLTLFSNVGYGSSFPSSPATGRVFFKI